MHRKDHTAYVYMLRRNDRKRFKLGYSSNPARRAQLLPEFDNKELDLACSYRVAFPSTQQAWAVEQAMHHNLAPYKVNPGHYANGHSEWFAQVAETLSLRLLSHMPGKARSFSFRRAHIEPLANAHTYPYPHPLDVWFAIEDLLLRLAQTCPVLTIHPQAPEVSIIELKTRTDPLAQELRTYATNLDTFEFTDPATGRSGWFVNFIEWEGPNLVLRFKHLATLRHHPDGEELHGLMSGFFNRLAGGWG